MILTSPTTASRAVTRERARQATIGAAAVVPVAVGVFADGGYGNGERIAFAATALLGAAVALVLGRERSPFGAVPAVLVALALVGGLSALWTVGLPERSLIWAVTAAGYAAVAVAGACAARAVGPEMIGAAIALLAAGAAVVGLTAVALHEPPYATRVAGAWRPAGPFEYAPALALLQVSALPVLLAGLSHRSRLVAAAATAGLALAAAVLATASSRTALAMAVAVVGIFLVARVGGRLRTTAVVGIAATALAAGALAFGSDAGRGDGPPTDFLHGRTATWGAAIDTFADRPWTGAGADAFLAASARHQDGQTIRFAHQLPLEVGVELGAAGLILALALYGAVARALWRARGTRAAWLLGPAAAAFLVASLLDWPWHLAGAGAVWALATGALGAAAQRKHTGQAEPRGHLNFGRTLDAQVHMDRGRRGVARPGGLRRR